MSAELAFTGERFVPGAKGEIWVEHWHRYHFARRWAAGKRVLDVACGEGYGSALLAGSAARVTGVDISEHAVAHARASYGELGNAVFECASCTRLPLPDASIDLAVSFETLEHIEEQERFLDELARVLTPGGILLLSCPNKLEYSDKRGFANEFHVKELYREELAKLVDERFGHVDWYGQRPTFFSLIAPEKAQPPQAQLVEVSEAQPDAASSSLSAPLYFVLAASRERASLEAVPPALSVLSDRDDWVHRDYEKVMGMLERSARHAHDLQRLVEQREAELAGLAAELEKLRAAITLQDAALTAQQALVHATATAHAAQVQALDAEIDRRRGWRWWLRLPLVRLGLLE
ncbi:MAG TPA: class I SAM-dependent methyltransferase [Usitatibacter sp.]|nr:class I SAM-dependent methyltransferase [Usitatibacter sp.]